VKKNDQKEYVAACKTQQIIKVYPTNV